MPPSIRRHKSRRTFGCDTCLATSSVVSRSKHLAVRWQVASGLATTFLMLSSTSRAHCGCKTSFGTPRSRKLAQAGCDTFTLSRIAGHSSTTLTRRYIHPQRTPLSAHFARISLTVKASRIGGGRSGRGSGGHKIGPGGMAKNRETLQVWCERGDSNPHGFTRQIISLKQGDDSKEDQQPTSAESSKTGKNPQPRRNRKRGEVIPFPKTGTQ